MLVILSGVDTVNADDVWDNITATELHFAKKHYSVDCTLFPFNTYDANVLCGRWSFLLQLVKCVKPPKANFFAVTENDKPVMNTSFIAW